MQKAEKPQIIPADHRGTMFGTGRTVSVSAQIPENVAVGQNKLTDAYNYATDESVSRKTEYDVPLYQLTHKENDGIKNERASNWIEDIQIETGIEHLDRVLEKATENTRKEGYARNFEKLGGEEQAVLDFEKRNPINRCLKETKYGQGIFAELSTGATIMYRPNSKTGGATLEIRVSSRKIYKIRYRRQ